MNKRIKTARNEYRNINMRDIMYLKADGNYTDIILASNEKITICKNLKKSTQELFFDDNFIKIRRNIVVNKDNIEKIRLGKKAYVTLINNDRLIPSNRLKHNLLK